MHDALWASFCFRLIFIKLRLEIKFKAVTSAKQPLTCDHPIVNNSSKRMEEEEKLRQLMSQHDEEEEEEEWSKPVEDHTLGHSTSSSLQNQLNCQRNSCARSSQGKQTIHTNSNTASGDSTSPNTHTQRLLNAELFSGSKPRHDSMSMTTITKAHRIHQSITNHNFYYCTNACTHMYNIPSVSLCTVDNNTLEPSASG